MTALSANLIASKDHHPERIALRCDDLQFTFTEFDAAAARGLNLRFSATYLDSRYTRYGTLDASGNVINGAPSGPLCLTNPSRVSQVKLSPSNAA